MTRLATAVSLSLLFLACACHNRQPRVFDDDRYGQPAGAQTPAAQPAAAASPKPSATVTPSQVQSIRQLGANLNNAPDRVSEAAAARQLWQYMRDNGLTYQINTVRATDGARVESASVSNEPVRVNMTIFRGTQLVGDVSFLPRDNRNIAVLSEGE
jgi:hypothetical protein